MNKYTSIIFVLASFCAITIECGLSSFSLSFSFPFGDMIVVNISLKPHISKGKPALTCCRSHFFVLKSWLKAYGNYGLNKIGRAFYLPMNHSILSTHKLFTKIEMNYGIRITKKNKNHLIQAIKLTAFQMVLTTGRRNQNKLNEKRENSKIAFYKNVKQECCHDLYSTNGGLDYILKWFSGKTFVFIWFDATEDRNTNSQKHYGLFSYFVVVVILLFFGSIYSHEWLMDFLWVCA